MYGGDKMDYPNIGPNIGRENTAVRETEISRVMGNLQKSIDVLESSIGAMEARLTGVMRNEPRRDEQDNMAEPEYNTRLAQEINNSQRRLVILKEVIESLLGRIEL